MTLRFERQPPTRGVASEVRIDVGGTTLSGLMADPAGGAEPTALVVALHGAGMHAGYFHSTAPGLSLLELGSQLGFAVWAPDRPGIGASGDLPDQRIGLFAQASLLLDAIEALSGTRPVGAGVFLVGHSYGLKVAWTMAAEARGADLLGLDGAGSGIRYAFDWAARRTAPPPPRRVGDRGEAWGPAELYPTATFREASLPLHPMPAVQAAEGRHWPNELRSMAHRIRVPMRLTFGEHDRLWPTDARHFDELRAVFTNVTRLSIEIEPSVGHNLSLGWAARAYHLKVFAFAESCALSGRLTTGPADEPQRYADGGGSI